MTIIRLPYIYLIYIIVINLWHILSILNLLIGQMKGSSKYVSAASSGEE